METSWDGVRAFDPPTAWKSKSLEKADAWMSSKGKREQMQHNMFSFARTVLILSVLIFFFFPSHLRLYQNKQTKKSKEKCSLASEP